MERGGDVRALARQRNFRRYLFALGTSDIGNRMSIVALAFAVLDIRHSASAVGLVLGSGSVAFLLGLAIGGVLGDRFDRRRVMVLCDLARLATQGVTAALVFSGDAELWSLALLTAATELGTGIFNPVSQGLAQSVVEERYYRAAAGVRAMALSTGEMIGPVVGGVIVAAASPAWALAADAGTFAASAVAIAGVWVAPREKRGEAEPSMLAQLVEGWSEFRARKWLWTTILAGGITQFVWGAWNVLGPLVASSDLGGAAVWGAILTAMGVGALVGATIATRTHARRPLVLFTACYATFALPILALAAGSPAVVVGASAFVTGLCVVLGESVWEAALLHAIPDELISRISAYDWLGSAALIPLGLAVWGPLASWIGTTTTLALGVVIVLVAMGALVGVREVRRFAATTAGDR